MRALLDQKGRA